MEDVVRQSQKYSTTLQSYNTSLQNDVLTEKTKRDELARAQEVLQGQVAELGGLVKSQEKMLELERVRGCSMSKICLSARHTRFAMSWAFVLVACIRSTTVCTTLCDTTAVACS